MTTTGIRTAAYVTALTLVVGALGGLVAAMTLFVPLDRSTSLVEARLGATVVKALWASLGLLYLVGPVFLAVGLAREDDRWVAHGLVAAGAVLGLPLAFAAFRLGNRVVVQQSGFVLTGGILLVGIAGAAGALLLAGRWLLRETAVGVSGVPLALVAVCLLAFVAVGLAGSGVADDLTANSLGKGFAQFEVEERTTADGTRVVVFTHEGGDPLPATGLRIVGEGFANADANADQTAPGAWQGEASGEFLRREGDYVVDGDAVTVAVGAECQIRVVRVDRDNSDTLALHECGADEG